MFQSRILLSTDELMSIAAMPSLGSNTFRAVKPGGRSILIEKRG
jgi:hypothetical protein